MNNEFLTMQNIARQTLLTLQDNLVLPNLCYRDFSDAYTDMGDTIQVRKPVVLEAHEFTDGDTVNRSALKESSVPVTLSTIATVDVGWSALEGATQMNESKLQRDFIAPAAQALAEKINGDGLRLYRKIINHSGQAGTTPSGLADFSAIRKQLNQNRAPLAGRVAIWDVEADASFSEIQGLTKVCEAGTAQTLREGEIGRLYGLDNYMSQAVQTHKAGTLTATGNGIKVKTAITNQMEVTLSTTASGTLTGTLKAGDRLTFGTAYGLVAQDVTASGNEVTVPLLAPLTVSAGTAVTLDSDYTANLAFHQNAIAFVSRPLLLPKGVEAYVATDRHNGISLRVFRGFNTETKREVMTMDVLYGFALLYPELAMVYRG